MAGASRGKQFGWISSPECLVGKLSVTAISETLSGAQRYISGMGSWAQSAAGGHAELYGDELVEEVTIL